MAIAVGGDLLASESLARVQCVSDGDPEVDSFRGLMKFLTHKFEKGHRHQRAGSPTVTLDEPGIYRGTPGAFPMSNIGNPCPLRCSDQVAELAHRSIKTGDASRVFRLSELHSNVRKDERDITPRCLRLRCFSEYRVQQLLKQCAPCGFGSDAQSVRDADNLCLIDRAVHKLLSADEQAGQIGLRESSSASVANVQAVKDRDREEDISGAATRHP
jgi:hypothetical protein